MPLLLVRLLAEDVVVRWGLCPRTPPQILFHPSRSGFTRQQDVLMDFVPQPKLRAMGGRAVGKIGRGRGGILGGGGAWAQEVLGKDEYLGL